VATFTDYVTRHWQGQEVTCRRVMRLIERTIDRQGQILLVPEVELHGWWTSLDLPDEQIIALYRDHATSEQFHSEFKTDLDLERLPSGKFDTNTLIMAMGGFVYNVLRWIGLVGLIGEHAPLRHPAKRRRLRTVMQELIYLAAKFYHRSRQYGLRFGRYCSAFEAGSSPIRVGRLVRLCQIPLFVNSLSRCLFSGNYSGNYSANKHEENA